jgi:hypothetical protein
MDKYFEGLPLKKVIIDGIECYKSDDGHFYRVDEGKTFVAIECSGDEYAVKINDFEDVDFSTVGGSNFMSLKEEFLKIKTYEEYDKRRDEFKNLDFKDWEIIKHLSNISPKSNIDVDNFKKGIMTEVYKTPPKRNKP